MWDSYRGHVAVALSPNGELLATSTRGESLAYVLNVGTRQLVAAVALPGPNATTLAWSPDSRILAAAARGDWLGAWEVETGYYAMKVRRPKVGIVGLSFLPTGNGVLSAMTDGTALVWSVARAGSETTPENN
jgi:WD40 repeat protein